MKKILSFIVALAMLCTVFVGSAYAADCLTFTLSSATAQPGETVTLTMEISNNPGITALGVTIAYPSELSLAAKATDAKLFGDNGGSTVPPAANNPYKYIWTEDFDNFYENGALYTIPVKVSEDAAPGEYEIVVTIPAESTYNADFDDVEVATVNGIITVAAPGPVVPTAETIGLATDAGKAIAGPINVENNDGSEYTINSALAFVSCVDTDKAEPVKTVIRRAESDKVLEIVAEHKTEIGDKTYFVAAVSSIKESSFGKTFTAIAVAKAGEYIVEGDAATGIYDAE